MGCTKVSPACDHCYAERDTKRFGRVEWGAGKPRVRTVAGNWRKVETWNRQRFMACTCGWRGECAAELIGCGACGSSDNLTDARRRVFSASLADWLDNEVPIEWLVDLLDLIRRTPNLDWLLLTKRIGNWRTRIGECIHYLDHHTDCTKPSPTREMLSAWWHAKQTPPSNVWLGITVVNQAEADRDILKLLAVPARVRFLSIEPMQGQVDVFSTMTGELLHTSGNDYNPGCIDWIIVGGESGPGARPMHREWARSLRDQCVAADVAFHFKQWGEWAPNWFNDTEGKEIADTMWMDRMGKKIAGRTLDGRTWDQFPKSFTTIHANVDAVLRGEA